MDENVDSVQVAPEITSGKGAKRGRKKLVIDLEFVKEMAAQQLDFAQMAGLLHCHEATIKRRYRDSAKFRDVIDEGRQSGKATLRSVLWRVGVRDRNVQVLLFLATNYLGMKRESVMPEDFNNRGGAGVSDIRQKMIDRLTAMSNKRANVGDAGDQAGAESVN